MIVKSEKKIPLQKLEDAVNVFGNHDENLHFIENDLGVQIVVRDGHLVVSGEMERVEQSTGVLNQLIELSALGNQITLREVQYSIKLVKDGHGEKIGDLASDVIAVTFRGKLVKPKTHGQKRYVDAIAENDIVFGIGPAGTGKTYLAVAMAAKALKEKAINRLIITRPAVEAGEKLGFLPGDLQEKVNPYLRPLYDSLYDILGTDKTQKLLEKNIIEIAPLAYMRGRTLDDAFIILDEAQNTTPEQMKMFLTRIGFGSKAVITGDVTQVDLPRGQYSGLLEARKTLGGIEGISFQQLSGADVMRHQLVQKIIAAYEKAEQEKETEKSNKSLS
ncbi:PhoH family protein [Phosphitispora fastidiosa]|uniref:PhoH family protein n=1 Tax=Phosphitispora fastidiosa TaxID=2837202 RepID=UPI001E33B198|nr:PhoH family protein [Phosphitispora fastidiosa]MBU7005888.1 phosphate starvation-inducible PhoH-like protein [Phosphitispora fastidiosa]